MRICLVQRLAGANAMQCPWKSPDEPHRARVLAIVPGPDSYILGMMQMLAWPSTLLRYVRHIFLITSPHRLLFPVYGVHILCLALCSQSQGSISTSILLTRYFTDLPVPEQAPLCQTRFDEPFSRHC